MAQFDMKKATVTFKDGTSPTPNSLTLKVNDGSMSYTEHKAREYKLDRGQLDTVRDGDEQPVDVRLDLRWEFITASTGGTPTPEDVLKNEGEASTWVTSDADTCAPYAVDIVIAFDPDCSPTQAETITLADFRYEQLDHNFKDGMISVSGKCNITKATAVRS